MRELLRRPSPGRASPRACPARHALTGERVASDGGAGSRLDGLEVLAAGLRGLGEDLVELLLALADELREVRAELVGVARHPVGGARLDLLVHAVQGGLQFGLERAAELLDQLLQLSKIGALDSTGHVTSPPCYADALLGPLGRSPSPRVGRTPQCLKCLTSMAVRSDAIGGHVGEAGKSPCFFAVRYLLAI